MKCTSIGRTLKTEEYFNILAFYLLNKDRLFGAFVEFCRNVFLDFETIIC